MRDGNFAKHPHTHPGWFTFGPTIGKPPRLAFVASQHFFIARLPLLALMQGGASAPSTLFLKPHPRIVQIAFWSTPASVVVISQPGERAAGL